MLTDNDFSENLELQAGDNLAWVGVRAWCTSIFWCRWYTSSARSSMCIGVVEVCAHGVRSEGHLWPFQGKNRQNFSRGPKISRLRRADSAYGARARRAKVRLQIHLVPLTVHGARGGQPAI